MEWLLLQPPEPLAAEFDQVVCMANRPVGSESTNAPPLLPGLIQAHLSAFSSPVRSVQPPDGFWSVMVSAYSCPSTIEKPSRLPPAPERTKCVPQEEPMSVT